MRNKSEMLAIVASLVHERGYHGTTMREIAKSLDMREAHLYALLGSKEDILWEIIVRVAQLFLAQARSIPREIPLLEQLRLLIYKHLEMIVQEQDNVTICTRDWMLLDAERCTEIQALRESYESYFYRVISEGRNRGLFQISDAQIACIFVLSALNWTQPWPLAIDAANLPAFAEQYTLLMCRALNLNEIAKDALPTQDGSLIPKKVINTGTID
jgi:TetR/AcrR family transcriptional regulator, cholesterol catabolism regulator